MRSPEPIVISIGDKFPLVVPNPLDQNHALLPLEWYQTEYRLRLPGMRPLPFDLYGNNEDVYQPGIEPMYRRFEVFTPFDIHLGHAPSVKDLESDSRVARLRDEWSTLGQRVYHPNAALSLNVWSHEDEPKGNYWEVLQDHDRFITEYPQATEQLSRLSLVLEFPDGSFRSDNRFPIDYRSLIDFEDFYPVELGPLAEITQRFSIEGEEINGLKRGLPLLLTNNFTRLSQASGYFLQR